MRFSIKYALLASTICGLSIPTTASATLNSFTDYQLGGLKGSWDIFYGANYLPVFSFDTGTVGNPMLNTLEPLTLRATVTTWTAGPPFPQNRQATGPIGSGEDINNIVIPGDREQFYTFFGSVNWDITESAPAAFDTFVFQAKVTPGSNGGLTSVLFNGLTPTTSSFDVSSGVGTWRWDGLGIGSGGNYALTWRTTTSHTVLDAYQIQAGVIPEPSTYALLGLTAGSFFFLRRRRTTIS